MNLIYLDDAYKTCIDTKISEISEDDNFITFDSSIVYPGGGGQPADIGWITYQHEKYKIVDCKKEGDTVWYRLDRKIAANNAQVTMEIDWDHRYMLMKTHTALHVLCGIMWNQYNSCVTGGNMEPLKARMDFQFEGFNKENIPGIEKMVNAEIRKNRNIKIRYCDDDSTLSGLIRTRENLIPENVKNVRLVEIEGLDIQADGGTHVQNTKEIEEIRIVGFENKGKINKRLKIEVR